MSFEDLGLSEALLKAVSKKGYTEPSPIQEKAIPEVLKRKDLLASAQTGTGKTAGFVLPIIQILNQGQQLRNRPIRSLVLTPTRELAAQIQENVQAYGEFTDIRSTVIFGGVNQNPQVRTLKQGVDILVATPGRLLDLHQQGHLKLDNVQILVLDEADRMLDMGFIHDIKRVLNIIPKRRQNLLFSATFSKEIKRLAGDLLNEPVRVEATPENTTAEMVEHKIYHTDKGSKTALVTKLIKDGNWSQVLIFTRMKHGANRLAQRLEKKGITSAAIHGNKTQGARTRALAGFKSGQVRVLVATDIAARGLDIPQLPHVINFELPNIPEDYVHRIGRTGRAGASGEAISLVSEDEMDHLRGIEKLLRQDLPSEVIEGFEPSFNPSATPSKSQPQSQQKPKQGGNSRSKNKRRNWRRNSRNKGRTQSS